MYKLYSGYNSEAKLLLKTSEKGENECTAVRGAEISTPKRCLLQKQNGTKLNRDQFTPPSQIYICG